MQYSAGSEVRERLKEEKVPLLETLPLVGYAKMICVSVFSATRYLLRRMNVEMTKPTAQQTTHRHVPRV
jgi:hypothetical protein